jgi:hypothetical protein
VDNQKLDGKGQLKRKDKSKWPKKRKKINSELMEFSADENLK